MLFGRPPRGQKLMLQQLAQRPVQRLLGDAEDFDQRTDRDVGLPCHHIEDAMVRARKAQRGKILVRRKRHATPTVIHELQRRVQIVQFPERSAVQARGARTGSWHFPTASAFSGSRYFFPRESRSLTRASSSSC